MKTLVRLTGRLNLSALCLSLSAIVLGRAIQFGNGFYIELKGLYNDSSGQSGNRYDPSGTALFGGMSFIF